MKAGTSGTVLQYPTTANPGGVRMKKKFHDLTANEKKATYSRALDTFLTVDESITIRTKEIYSPILTVNYDEEWEVELSVVSTTVCWSSKTGLQKLLIK